ncbi:hypothetical protein VE01_09446 [Pseudogymnoascus verrucosus]|uniref:F-box domain-containing protein n=1 Tax=Pseudogymnoascus verrucosus TaxID=342668 RepID=A0A1B8G9Q2_9PEZI|nr:uncharacterized protein VE01_09446 [Pseudogymnoascus verrucosus]OBT92553.1 hypothetical protein VE01_09446 [Pseudogymnoascus verrucosus]
MASLHPDGLQQLPVEIFLNIVMQLGSGDIGSLLGSSKTIRSILKSHEEYLSRQFASYLYPKRKRTSKKPILAWPILTRPSPPLKPKHILSRCIPTLIRFPYTFSWVAEQEKRKKVLRDLSNSQLLNVTIPNLLVSIFGTSTRICACCGLSGIKVFKSHGLNMLLRLSDARISGSTPVEEKKISIDDAHRSQKLWICQQDKLALASMLALVWVASTTFDYGDRSTWGAGSCNNNCGIPGEQSEDINLAKRRCTYRELALVHGPYFLWCSVSESEKETRWVKDMLDEGVEYEKGVESMEGVESEEGVEDARMAHHSLQSVLLSRLAGLKGWEGWEGWYEAFSAFGEEILFCRAWGVAR